MVNIGDVISFSDGDVVCRKAIVEDWADQWIKVQHSANEVIQWVNTDNLSIIQPPQAESNESL